MRETVGFFVINDLQLENSQLLSEQSSVIQKQNEQLIKQIESLKEQLPILTNQLNPYEYFAYLLKELLKYSRENVPEEELKKLMPWSEVLPDSHRKNKSRFCWTDRVFAIYGSFLILYDKIFLLL